MLASEHFDILDRLLAQQHTNVAIKYNTNLSTLCFRDINVLDKWQHFQNVTVGASIDASGAVAEYMRHGTVWSDIVNNIKNIKHHAPHVQLKIESVVSFLTIENLMQLQLDWINQRMFDINDFTVQVLVNPNFLSLAVLPAHHKHRLSDCITKHADQFAGTQLAQQWLYVLQWMNNNDHTFALEDFVHRTRVLDAHRNECFEKIFPQYKDLT